LAFVNQFTVKPGLLDVDVHNVIRVDCKHILIEHNHVGQLARLDATLPVLFKRQIGAACAASAHLGRIGPFHQETRLLFLV